MDNLIYDEYFLYKIAREYYDCGKLQEAIAQEYHISRPHVSRLLTKARELGIVQITVKNPKERHIEELKERFKLLTGVSYVEIVPINSKEKYRFEDIVSSISSLAADVLNDYLKDSEYIGIGEGRTIYNTAKKIKNSEGFEHLTFVPLTGVAASDISFMQTNTIVDTISNSYKSRKYFTNTPIIVEEKDLTSGILKKNYDELKAQWSKLDTAIVGFGEPYDNTNKSFLLNEASEHYKKVIARSKNVGDILTSFLDEEGNDIVVNSEFNKITLSLHQLKNISKVLCIAGGHNKEKGIFTAIKYEYINGLVTDSVTAEKIISIAERSK